MNDRIERNGRQYQYSESDDTWYPVPTEAEYAREWVTIVVCTLILAVFVLYRIFH